MRGTLLWALLARGSAFVVHDDHTLLLKEREATLRAEAAHHRHEQPEVVPPHLVCISNLAVLYFSAYLANIMVRLCCSFWERCFAGRSHDDLRLAKAVESLDYVPALCTLFLATRVWTLATTSVDTADLHRTMLRVLTGSMYTVSAAVLVEYILAVFQPEEKRGFLGTVVGSLARGVVLAGAVVILVAIFTSPVTPSIATLGVAALLTCYFGVHSMLSAKDAVGKHCFPNAAPEKAEDAVKVARVKETLTLIPMLCVLLVCLRMRSLELSTHVPEAAEHGIALLVVAYCVQVAAVLAQGLFVESEKGEAASLPTKGASCGTAVALGLSVLENLSLLAVYGAIVVLVGHLLMLEEDPADAYAVAVEPSLLQLVQAGDPIPTSMKCVTMLSVLFFFVYLSILVSRSLQYCTHLLCPRASFTTKKVEDTLKKAEDDVMFVPMLSVLMIALRLRAFTFYQADPPVWAQYAMYVCVFSLILQVLMSPLLIALKDLFRDESAPMDPCNIAAVALFLLRYIVLTVFYIGVATLLVAVWWQ